MELVRSILEAWAKGDFSSAEWADPDIQVVAADGPAPEVWRGVGEMARGWREYLSEFDDFRAEAEEYRRLDDERVLVLLRNSGRGKASGAELGEMRSRGANVFHVRNGKVVKLFLYWDRDKALADLGL